MASIQSLLNPLPDLCRFPLPSPSLASSTGTEASDSPRQKKQKVAKDAPVFNRGGISGELRYAPCEERDEELTQIHREFQIRPMGDIAAYPRHIPYNSDKKSFQERTGRESFEVFQYTFKIPGEDKEWVVMWDYNIGLVRITHLFKCLDYPKTAPGKMMNANPGLRRICHSITGGALAAQGYWMPFEAAKAVSATFCWKIRYALTPLFGLDFPSLCTHPHDRAHGRMIIDPAIVMKATETANRYRMLQLRSPPLSAFRPSFRPTSSPDVFIAAKKQLIPRSHRRHADNLSTATTTTASSGYGSSDEPYHSDAYCVSPAGSYRNSFTPVKTPRSTGAEVVYTGSGTGTGFESAVPTATAREVFLSISQKRGVIADEEAAGTDTDKSTETSPSTYSIPSSPASDCPSLDLNDDRKDEDYGDVDNKKGTNHKVGTAASSDATANPNLKRKLLTHRQLVARDVNAAHVLISLSSQDASGSDDEEPVSVSSLTGVHQQQQQQQLTQERKRRRASA